MTSGSSTTPVFDFTSLDWASLRSDLVTYVQRKHPTSLWTDFNPSNPGTWLLETQAYVGELIAYFVNMAVKETFVSTLVRKQNFNKIAKSYNYEITRPARSTTTLQITLDPLASYPLTISQHHQYASTSGVVFQPTADTTVAAYGAGTETVEVVQGEEAFEEALGTSTGLPHQSFQLANTGLDKETLVVMVDSETYTLETSSANALSTDKVFFLDIDEDDNAFVSFGDGVHGFVPPAGDAILATYRFGGGVDGNLPAGVVTSPYGSSDGSALTGQLSVTNTVEAEGGAPMQTLRDAKLAFGGAVQANDRCVTDDDYAAIVVSEVSGAIKAKALPGRYAGGGFPILLFVVTATYTITNALINAIGNTLANKKMLGKRAYVKQPTYVYLDVDVEIRLQEAASSANVIKLTQGALESQYAVGVVDFGGRHNLQDAYDLLTPTNVRGVGSTLFRKFSVVPYYGRYVNIPTTGAGTIEEIVTTETVKRREWCITFGASGTFTVKQRRLGTVKTLTDTVLYDDTANYETDELTAWTLHLREQDQATTQAISSNTGQYITSATSGLSILATNGDSYAVEKTEASAGIIGRILFGANEAVGQTVLSVNAVPASANFLAGHNIIIRDAAGGNIFRTTVVSTATSPNNTITIADPLPYAYVTNDLIDHEWVSDDETVRFVVVQGTPAFANGDTMYVDTFAKAEDLVLRPESYLRISLENVAIQTIGGV